MEEREVKNRLQKLEDLRMGQLMEKEAHEHLIAEKEFMEAKRKKATEVMKK